MKPRAAIVVDLGFGDAGKGIVTDALVRRLGASIVVRSHGGAQAGHNVFGADGRHHTFAQLGSGTFSGARTVLARHMIVHPTALLVEARALELAGVPDPLALLTASERALVTTPFHQAACRLRELLRARTAGGRHGSCGVGVGETGAEAERDDALRLGDLRDAATTRAKLANLVERKRASLGDELTALVGDAAATPEIEVFERAAEMADRWREACSELVARRIIVSDAAIARDVASARAVVFEGAQGVLLDEWVGFHPHTTWSTCTFARPLELLAEAAFDGDVARVGVLRAHAVRHGAGPLPTESAELAARLDEPHNVEGPWQGCVRVGHLDLVLARYAASACRGVDVVALTHLDRVERLEERFVCRAYEARGEGPFVDWTRDDVGHLVAPPMSRGHDLERQARTGRDLRRVAPVYERASMEQLVAYVEDAVSARVTIEGRGPTTVQVRFAAGSAW